MASCHSLKSTESNTTRFIRSDDNCKAYLCAGFGEHSTVSAFKLTPPRRFNSDVREIYYAVICNYIDHPSASQGPIQCTNGLSCRTNDSTRRRSLIGMRATRRSLLYVLYSTYNRDRVLYTFGPTDRRHPPGGCFSPPGTQCGGLPFPRAKRVGARCPARIVCDLGIVWPTKAALSRRFPRSLRPRYFLRCPRECEPG